MTSRFTIVYWYVQIYNLECTNSQMNPSMGRHFFRTHHQGLGLLMKRLLQHKDELFFKVFLSICLPLEFMSLLALYFRIIEEKHVDFCQMHVHVLQTTPRNNLDVLFLCLTFVVNLALDQYIGEAMV